MWDQTEPVGPCSPTLFLRPLLQYENEKLKISSLWISRLQSAGQNERVNCEAYQKLLKIQADGKFTEKDQESIRKSLSAGVAQ